MLSGIHMDSLFNYSVISLKGSTGEVIWWVDLTRDRSIPSVYSHSHRTWTGISPDMSDRTKQVKNNSFFLRKNPESTPLAILSRP